MGSSLPSGSRNRKMPKNKRCAFTVAQKFCPPQLEALQDEFADSSRVGRPLRSSLEPAWLFQPQARERSGFSGEAVDFRLDWGIPVTDTPEITDTRRSPIPRRSDRSGPFAANGAVVSNAQGPSGVVPEEGSKGGWSTWNGRRCLVSGAETCKTDV